MSKLLEPIIQARMGTIRAIHLVWSISPNWTTASVALLLIQGLLPLASLYMLKLIVDAVTEGGQSFYHIALLISLAALTALLNLMSLSASSLVEESQAALVSDGIQDMLHAKSIALDLEYYENAQYHDSLHRAQAEAPYRPVRIVYELSQLGKNSISLAGVALLLTTYNWLLAAALLIALVPAAFVRLRYSLKLYSWQRSVTQRERLAWYLHWLLVGIDYAKEVRLFDLGDHFKQQYQNLRGNLRREKLQIHSRRALAELAAQSLAVLALFGALLFISQQTSLGIITVGSLVMYFGAFQQGQIFLQNMLQSLAGLYEDNLFLTDLYEFLDLEPRIIEPNNPQPVPMPILYGIDFENLSFQYPGKKQNALEDITLHIPAGHTIALVGENGSGKTTLIKLLCRLYDPQKGRITIDGQDLRSFSPTSWHKQISVILQDYVHYSMTVSDNIWFGDISQPLHMPRIIHAAEFSGASEFIRDLDEGYNTLLGRQFENGVELSIGEWQKIALARAFMSHAQLLILDEPSSSLDPSAEEQVFQRFRQLAQCKTTIIISHRLSNVRSANCIYFMKAGRIIEMGRHEELMEQNGEYARLFRLQAQHYH